MNTYLILFSDPIDLGQALFSIVFAYVSRQHEHAIGLQYTGNNISF